MRTLFIPLCCAALLLCAPVAADARPAKQTAKSTASKAVSKPAKKMARKPVATKKTTAKKMMAKKKPRRWFGAVQVSSTRQRPVFIAIPVAKRSYTRPDLDLKREAYRSLR